jgi:hypothetical protein
MHYISLTSCITRPPSWQRVRPALSCTASCPHNYKRLGSESRPEPHLKSDSDAGQDLRFTGLSPRLGRGFPRVSDDSDAALGRGGRTSRLPPGSESPQATPRRPSRPSPTSESAFPHVRVGPSLRRPSARPSSVPTAGPPGPRRGPTPESPDGPSPRPPTVTQPASQAGGDRAVAAWQAFPSLVGQHLGSTGAALGQHWGSTGAALGQHWGSTGAALGQHWGSTGARPINLAHAAVSARSERPGRPGPPTFPLSHRGDRPGPGSRAAALYPLPYRDQ